MMKFIVFLLLQLYLVNSFKYLVYNVKFGRSHTIYMNLIADTLAKHGHEVVSYEPIYADDFNDTGVKLAKSISRELSYPIDFDKEFMHKFVWSNGGFGDILEAFKVGVKKFPEMFTKNCKDQLQDKEMMSKLRAMKFDLLLTEYFDPCGVVIGLAAGIKKHITIYSMPMPSFANLVLGLPASTSFVPDLYASQTPKMSMAGRAKNIFSSFFFYNLMHKPLFDGVEEVAQEFFGSDFNFMEKASETSLIFVNTDEMLDFPRPITHKVVYIGGLVGLSYQKVNKLPENLEKIYENAKHGVIYMSFGTVAPSYVMPQEYKNAFLEAFAEFPDVTFLWKYEVDDGVANGYKNVITDKWFPQKDLLAHPKTLLFISHGGMNSLAEASYSGQPILAVPLFADQFRNAQTAKWHGYGEMLDKSNLTKQTVVDGIRKIINNESYRIKAKEMAKILSSKAIEPEMLFIRNVEFATKFDLNNHLNMYGSKLTTVQYYNLDLYTIAFLVVSIVLYLFYRTVKLLVCCICRAKKIKIE